MSFADDRFAVGVVHTASGARGSRSRRRAVWCRPCRSTSRWLVHEVDHRMRGLGSNSELFAPASPSTLRANSMPSPASPRQIPRHGMSCSRAYPAAAILPSMPRSPKPPGMSTPSRSVETGGSEQPLDLLGLDPVDLHLGAVMEPGVLETFDDREVRVVELDVLADQADPAPVLVAASILATISCHGVRSGSRLDTQDAHTRTSRALRRAASAGARRCCWHRRH